MPFIEMLIRIAPKGENNCIIKIVPTFNEFLAIFLTFLLNFPVYHIQISPYLPTKNLIHWIDESKPKVSTEGLIDWAGE